MSYKRRQKDIERSLKKHNPIAKDLRTSKYAQRVVSSKKKYKRLTNNELQQRYMLNDKNETEN